MKGVSSTAALLIDDEPEYLQWVEEFLLKRYQLTTDRARTLNEALDRVARREYRLTIVDMEIPAHGAAGTLAEQRGPTAEKYPGLAAIVHLRSMGYDPHQVIAFTVHDDGLLDAELKKLDCRYVLKGRPEDFKDAVRTALATKPSVVQRAIAKHRRSP